MLIHLRQGKDQTWDIDRRSGEVKEREQDTLFISLLQQALNCSEVICFVGALPHQNINLWGVIFMYGIYHICGTSQSVSNSNYFLYLLDGWINA